VGSPITTSHAVPLIGTDHAACRECWGCVRYCPANAIRVVDGRGEIIEEKCVACGLCVSECGHHGHVVRDDTPQVWDLLDGGRPVVAILATEFVAAMHPMPPAEVERALEELGFYAVESTALGEEMVAAEYAKAANRQTPFPLLRSTCPVTVEWVRRYHPALAQALVPVIPPYVAQARLVRELYPRDVAVVYVSPCYARKDEIRDPEFEDAVDVAIDFFELRRMIESGRRKTGMGEVSGCGARRPVPVKELSLTDGFPRSIVAGANPLSTDVLVCRGLAELDAVLVGIERGESGPMMVDMLNCEGCIDGPTVNPGMSVFAKRNIESAERQAQGRTAVSSRALLRHLPSVDLLRSFPPRPVIVPMPTEADIDRILAAGRFTSRSETIDCGACGYRTCMQHAVAIFQGNSTWDLCFPLQRALLSEKVAHLEEERTLDALTGLWNRRMLSERLVDEVGRWVRYGINVTLLLVNIDGFSLINERYGCEAGDAVLAAVGGHLRANVRITDLVARYGDDTFAVILPSQRKTMGFAVAEKLRVAVAALMPPAPGDGYTTLVPVTVSVGVAAATPAVPTAAGLIEAADAALIEAKESGRDQVRLAPDEG
jgi:diguanylate cyclase (GGDEF)-like protein